MAKMTDLHYDLCVIGGGINGAGIARDAAGRGLSVLLVEAQDLAGATSSASTKLIHGGLRYLENYDFKMVRKALKEREILLRTAPHLVHPIACVLPQDEEARPEWMIRIGLFLYDHLGGRKSLPNSRLVDFAEDDVGAPLHPDIEKGVIYYDGWGDDTRLVIMNAVDAASRGAKVLTHTSCTHLDVQEARWRVGLRDNKTGDTLDISAAMVVNATGPWVGQFLQGVGVGEGDPDLPSVRLVKGSHILLPKQYDGDHAYVLQQGDGRVVFVAPYEQDYTVIGTTEESYNGDPGDAMISDAEMTYLCHAFNDGFRRQITPDDVIFAYSGIRPLLDDGAENNSKVTRDYLIYHHNRYDPPLLSVYGGKLTTYRTLSEDVMDRLMMMAGHVPQGWTADVPLAGGDFGGHDLKTFIFYQKQQYPWLPQDLLMRYVRAYGSHMDYFLYGKESLEDMGVHYGDQVYQAEIDYLVQHEWAGSAEDIIWRRSKLGLHISDQTIHNIEAALSAYVS